MHGDKIQVSSECKDFIRKLLLPDSTKRMKMNELMKHDWIVNNITHSEVTQGEEAKQGEGGNHAGNVIGVEVTYNNEQNQLLLTDAMLRAIVEKERLERIKEDKLDEAEQSLEEDDDLGLSSLHQLFVKNLAKLRSEKQDVAESNGENDALIQKYTLQRKKGQFVFRAGNQVDGMYIVKKGSLFTCLL